MSLASDHESGISGFFFFFLIDGYHSVFGYELMEAESLLSFAST